MQLIDHKVKYVNNYFSRETLLVKLDTGDNTELSYVPGDHVGIFPRNDEKMVEALLDKLSDVPDAEQIVNLEMSLENSGMSYCNMVVLMSEGRGSLFW